MSNNVAAKLREARALIAKGWCRNDYGCAGRVCAMGAINQAYTGESDGLGDARAIGFFRRAIGNRGIIPWNDSQKSKHPVLAAFDRAIELAEAGQ